MDFDPLSFFTPGPEAEDEVEIEPVTPQSTTTPFGHQSQSNKSNLEDQDDYNDEGLIHIFDLPTPSPTITPSYIILTLLKLLAPEQETNFGHQHHTNEADPTKEEVLKEKGVIEEEFETTKQWLTNHVYTRLSTNLLSLKWNIESQSLFTYLQSLLTNYQQDEEILTLTSLRISESSGRTARPSTTRKIHIPLHPTTPQIILNEPALVSDNLGLKTWGSSLVLAELLIEKKQKGLSGGDCVLYGEVLELGSGTGLTGISIALMGYQITLTDLPEITPNLKHNVQLNNCEDKADVYNLDWTNPAEFISIKGEGVKYDTIIVADPIYSPEHPLWVVNMLTLFLRRTRDAKVIVQIPLRKGYEKERDLLWRLTKDKGLVVVEEGQRTGFDEFGEMGFVYKELRWDDKQLAT